ncbi:hypothetical protein RF55_11362 [Lasius niger]|uniref:Uncharacterized protein n=1 Tax=Lasius niger TaxID=67767 RepID=A0A0J7N8R6_LASNI|nr:hypothetical protein RF55_11362 [Lasius niger]
MLLEKVLGRKVGVRGVEEKLGEGGRRILLVVMEKGEDRDEVLARKGEVWGRWRMVVDEDLTREEGKMKWRIKEKARLERNKRNWVVYDSRRLWIGNGNGMKRKRFGKYARMIREERERREKVWGDEQRETGEERGRCLCFYCSKDPGKRSYRSREGERTLRRKG